MKNQLQLPSNHRANTQAVDILRPHMPELDSVRGIAVLLVLFFHGLGFRYGLGGLSGLPRILVAATLPGWAGVNLFFVLSGFLITGILLDAKQRPDYFGRFYFRRALRILPLYYLVLFLLAVLSWTGQIDRTVSWSFLGLSGVYLANVTQLFGVPMQFGVLWSLAVEEHFYLVWPAIVRLVSRRGVILYSIFICVLCLVLRVLYYHFDLNTGTGYTWLVADGLAMGAALAAVARSPSKARSRVRFVAVGALTTSLLLFGVLAPFGIFRASRFLGLTLRETVLNLLCLGIIASTLLVGTSRWKSLVNRPLLQYFGEISYGIYLIHMLVFEVLDHYLKGVTAGSAPSHGDFPGMLLRFAVGAGLTIGLAAVSRRYFESPILRLKDKSLRARKVELESAA